MILHKNRLSDFGDARFNRRLRDSGSNSFVRGLIVRVGQNVVAVQLFFAYARGNAFRRGYHHFAVYS